MVKSEKRGTPRVPVYTEAFSESFLVGILKNISREGMFILTTEPKEVGTRMELSLALPGNEKERIRIEAEVVRVCRPSDLQEAEETGQAGKSLVDGPGMGLRILSIAPQDLALLMSFLRDAPSS